MSTNQLEYTDYIQKGHFSIHDWSKCWIDKSTNWHRSIYSPDLLRFYPSCIARMGRRSTVLVPLCGKTLDLIWLAGNGEKVIGIEAVEQACHEFFGENNIPYVVEKVQGSDCRIFASQADALDITIFNCDFYALTAQLIGCRCDTVWDRGSFVAINPDTRVHYAQQLASLMNSGGRSLLSALEYDYRERHDPGPPFCISESVANDTFSPFASIIKLQTTVLPKERFASYGLSCVKEHIFKLTFD